VVELGVAFEEFGRVLLGGPFLASAGLATTLLDRAGEAGGRFLPGLCTGEYTATLAVQEGRDPWSPGGMRTVARSTAGRWSVSGRKLYVLDGHDADLILVVAHAGSELAVLAIEPSAVDGQSLTRTVESTVDPTRKLATLEFRDTPAEVVLTGTSAALAVRRALAVGSALLAAEQTGGLDRVLEMTVEHVRSRRQFGRPIGSFQAVKHRCADMVVRRETARAAAYHALWAATGTDLHTVEEAAAIAASYCSESFVWCAEQAVQLHGGIGFTWEHDAHLYLKRALGSQELLGSPRYHRRRLRPSAGV
jgi:alkylation response protein AidB-like acyl-CoA dehydrogenase